MWTCVYKLKRSWVKDYKRNLVISFITIVFLLHPKLTERSISAFKCVEIDNGYSVARIDTNLECYSETHIKWILFVAIPIIILWVLLCPALALGAMYYGDPDPESNSMKAYLLILYEGLKPEAMYWEFVNTLRKGVILMSLLFSRNLSIWVSMVVLGLTARWEVLLKPYSNPENSRLEYLAMMAGF
jgi:hypothetical protein